MDVKKKKKVRKKAKVTSKKKIVGLLSWKEKTEDSSKFADFSCSDKSVTIQEFKLQPGL